MLPGSPPRLRGILRTDVFKCRDLRFTPAPAGNAARASWRMNAMAVHPRACGEYAVAYLAKPAAPGSPPRLRGIPDRTPQVREQVRFTPAPAGNTTERPAERVCPLGSPPRLRGIQGDNIMSPSLHRFTPAPAGNTRGSCGPAPPSSVHPRACGEYSSDTSTVKASTGSPPRLRGIRTLTS